MKTEKNIKIIKNIKDELVDKICDDCWTTNNCVNTTNVKLVRVIYGTADTVVDDRKYQIDGKGPVGTFAEFREAFPINTWEIIDDVNPKYTFWSLKYKRKEKIKDGL